MRVGTQEIIICYALFLQIKASNAGSTYIWKPISKTYPIKFIEIIYTMIVLIASSVSIVFLLYIIPYSKSDELCKQYPLVGIGFALQWMGNLGLEIYHIKETYDHGVYGNLRIIFMVVAQLVIDILCMISVFAYMYMHKKPNQETSAYRYTFVVTFGWSLLRQLIMLFFFALNFVYFTEPISTVGVVAFGVIFTFMWSYLSKFVYGKVLAIGMNSIFFYHLHSCRCICLLLHQCPHLFHDNYVHHLFELFSNSTCG